jgi:hypothetical protein
MSRRAERTRGRCIDYGLATGRKTFVTFIARSSRPGDTATS